LKRTPRSLISLLGSEKHEAVQAAELGHQLLAGAQGQVIGVGQEHLGTRCSQLLGRHGAHRRLGAHHHEGGGVDLTVGRREHAGAGRTAGLLEGVAEGLAHRRAC
jgi:hypothetical protein